MDYDDGNDNDNPLPSHLQSLQYKRKNNNNKGGWAGDELEMQHQMEHLSNNNTKNATAAVDLSQFRNEEVGVGYQAKGVIRQRGGKNSNIGNGGGNSLNIIDMTQKVKSEKNDDEDHDSDSRSHRKKKKKQKKKSKKRKHSSKHHSDDDDNDDDSSSDHKKSKKKKKKKQRQSEESSINDKESISSPKDDKDALLRKYLKCDAIRTFCKEIEKIVAEASK